MKFTKDNLSWIVFISFIAIVLLSIIIVFVSRSIVKPIENAATIANRTAEGDFAFIVKEETLQRKDELGDLTKIFQKVSTNTRDLIEEIQTNRHALITSSEIVAAGAEQSRSASQEVATDLMNVSSHTDNQMNAAIESAQSMEEMAGGVQRVADAATNVAHMTAEMTEMLM